MLVGLLSLLAVTPPEDRPTFVVTAPLLTTPVSVPYQIPDVSA